MRKLFTFVSVLLLSASLWAQTPQKFSYQAVIRNSSSELIANQKVGIRISILQTSASGVVTYSERHEPTTNSNGLVSIEIGGGTVSSGDFSKIDWAKGPYYVRTETDLKGGTDYTISGETQLLSVPYALFAANNSVGPAGKDGINGQQGIQGLKGDKGDTGAVGKDGVDGQQGIQGLKGDKGDTGAAGKDGINGQQGIQGLKGDKGDTGAAGKDGVDGQQGIQGLKGDKGDTGAAGKDGINGQQGIQGLKGDTGVQGPIGPAGPSKDEQKLYVSATGDTLYLQNGGFVIIPGLSSANPKTKPTSGYGANITDIDGNTYKTVYIGTQQWMAENLKTAKYNDGTIIPNVSDNSWENNTSGAWVYYNNDLTYNAKYGKLYNGYAVSTTSNGNKNVCPYGWHVPSDVEWTILTDYLGGDGYAGVKMKEVGTTSWISPNTDVTNSSLFTGLPGGYRFRWGLNFDFIGSMGYWWSSTETTSDVAWFRRLNSSYVGSERNTTEKYWGLSIRCLKD